MTWNEFVYGLGDVITATFKILKVLGNIPNTIFILLIMGCIGYWLIQLMKFKKEAKANGTIE